MGPWTSHKKDPLKQRALEWGTPLLVIGVVVIGAAFCSYVTSGNQGGPGAVVRPVLNVESVLVFNGGIDRNPSIPVDQGLIFSAGERSFSGTTGSIGVIFQELWPHGLHFVGKGNADSGSGSWLAGIFERWRFAVEEVLRYYLRPYLASWCLADVFKEQRKQYSHMVWIGSVKLGRAAHDLNPGPLIDTHGSKVNAVGFLHRVPLMTRHDSIIGSRPSNGERQQYADHLSGRHLGPLCLPPLLEPRQAGYFLQGLGLLSMLLSIFSFIALLDWGIRDGIVRALMCVVSGLLFSFLALFLIHRAFDIAVSSILSLGRTVTV